MRKKSHVALSGHLIREFSVQHPIRHRGSFVAGSLLPDLVPSFLVRKHRIDQTGRILKKKLIRVLNDPDLNRRRTKDLGVITHYLADYYTFPHNRQYPGSFKDHCVYEEYLKHGLRAYLRDLRADTAPDEAAADFLEHCTAPEDIIDYVRRDHRSYIRTRMKQIRKGTGMDAKKMAEEDCYHIVMVNRAVLAAIIKLRKDGQHHE